MLHRARVTSKYLYPPNGLSHLGWQAKSGFLVHGVGFWNRKWLELLIKGVQFV